MAERNWTSDQKKAIDGRRGTMLVSAAAGSGKTAVLVERVIRRLTDKEDPCSVEELLVVTFTKAAAAQMKSKIAGAITEKITENPADGDLRRQQMLLPLAQICTIDSFCINLVRDNFHVLGVSPDFNVLDENRLTILRTDALNTVLDKAYAENSEGFRQLCDLVCDSRDDSALTEAILKIYTVAQAYPFPGEWLDGLESAFSDTADLTKTVWGRQILQSLQKQMDYAVSLLESAKQVIAGDEVMAQAYTAVADNELMQIRALSAALHGKSWDEVKNAFVPPVFVTLPRAPTGYKSEEKDLFQKLRNEVKELVKEESIASFFPADSAEHREDMKRLQPALSALFRAVRDFEAKFSRLKTEENGADFNDTLHLAIRLLADRQGDKVVPSETALEQAEQFREILIDEYQDVNEAQDLVFRLISRNGSNLFMVGDVKQSIYGFRQAMPEIFLKKRESYAPFTGENYPATVVLGRNFRSRQGVTDNVNHIFSRLMTEGVGGLAYGPGDWLNHNPDGYIDHDLPDGELHIITGKEKDYAEREAAYIAEYIEQNRGTLLVKDGSSQRPAEYGDFCVLYRSMGEEARAMLAELEKRGIPVVCDAAGHFFEAPEIRFMLSLMRVLDNPVDDVSMLAVLLSPVFGFIPDELAQMRAARREGSLFHCLVYAAEKGNPKAAQFLDKLASLRRVAGTVTAAELVRRLLEDTGYLAVVSALRDAHIRRANLHLLVDFAARYEQSGKTGLSGFLRYVDRAVQSNADVRGAENAAEGTDVVRIMTIHKSKGLEFPVTILGGSAKKFNTSDTKQNIIIGNRCGFGIRGTDARGFVRYETVPRMAAQLEKKEAERAEELRVLYVALTRAKEKFVIVGTVKSASELKKAAFAVGEKVDPHAVINAGSSLQLFCMALINHPDAGALRTFTGACGVNLAHGAPRLQVTISDGTVPEKLPADEEKETEDTAALLEEIRARLGYEYPYASLMGVEAKRVASDFSHSSETMEYFASQRPAFMSKNSLTPAQRGSATHRFVQYADLNAGDAEGELKRLVDEHILTQLQADAVDMQQAKAFFGSELAKRMLLAETVYREKSFTCAVPAGALQPDLPPCAAEETVVIDGVADCAFVEDGQLVIVDYKTDRGVTAEELVQRYAGQLGVYRRCLAEVLHMPVKETLIYSFALGQTIPV